MNRSLHARTMLFALLWWVATQALAAEAPDAAALKDMLHAFLAGATANDPAAHDRFWAEDLVYTSSSGERFGKAQIMDGLKAPPDQDSAEPALVYSAEDIRIRQYGDTAVVAFQLLGTRQADESSGTPATILRFFNTGTFLRRDGVWQVVAWQATRIPESSPQVQ